MKKIVLSMFAFANLLLLSPVVHAEPLTQHEFVLRMHKSEELSERIRRTYTYRDKLLKLRYHGLQQYQQNVNVPELNVTNLGAPVFLLVGGYLVLTSRRKKLVS